MMTSCIPQRWLVVILTHNEAPSLVKVCLSSLREAANRLLVYNPNATVHIRVVDDSHPAIRAKWEHTARNSKVEILHVPGTISQKRNAGCRDVNADIIAFTDADCQVDEEWLIAHSHIYATYPSTPGIVGKTLHQANSTLTYTAADYAGFLIGFKFPDMMPDTLWGPCSNLSLRMNIFQAVNGFDEAFSYASEDVDIGLRICNQIGERLACLTNAPVRHAVEPFAKGIYKRAWLWGSGEAMLISRHSDNRVIAPPQPVLFFLVALGWALTDLIVHKHFLTLIGFISVYIVFGPLIEAKGAKLKWSVIIRARVLQALFQFRTYFSLLTIGKLQLLFTQMNYGHGQFIYQWPAVTRTMWEFFIFLLLVGLTTL